MLVAIEIDTIDTLVISSVHDCFQYVVDCDDTDDYISIIQSGAEQIPSGSRVTIAIGTNTRIIISE